MSEKTDTNQPWYADGLSFTCTQCGNCCTGGPGYVWISDMEIDRLAGTGDEAAVYTDQAYDKAARRTALAQRGIKPRLMFRPNRHHPLTPRQARFATPDLDWFLDRSSALHESNAQRPRVSVGLAAHSLREPTGDVFQHPVADRPVVERSGLFVDRGRRTSRCTVASPVPWRAPRARPELPPRRPSSCPLPIPWLRTTGTSPAVERLASLPPFHEHLVRVATRAPAPHSRSARRRAWPQNRSASSMASCRWSGCSRPMVSA